MCERITRDDITPDSLASMILDPVRRAALLAALREQGPPLLHQRIAKIAPRCNASGDELDLFVDILLREDVDDDILDWLVYHPMMHDHSLIRLLDHGRCIGSLGHRCGPEHLLLRLAREHRYPEAILTLALYHYGPDPARREEFLSFVAEHLDVAWLRESLRVSDAAMRIPEESRRAALQLYSEYEGRRVKPA
jgi:hypothetical protein